jgi:hypothetical protein
VKEILKHQPNLVYYNKNNISGRLAKLGMLVAFNGFTNRYEIHSLKSFEYDGNSIQDSVETDELLNQYLIRDIKGNNHERFMRELEGERRRLERQVELYEERTQQANTEGLVQGVERLLGRRF